VKRPFNRAFAGNQRQANHQEAACPLPGSGVVGTVLHGPGLESMHLGNQATVPRGLGKTFYRPSLDGVKFKPLYPRKLQGRSSSQTHPHFILALRRESSSNSTRLLARLVLLKIAENNRDCKSVISLRLSNITLCKLYPFPVHGTIRLQRLSHILPYKAFFSGHDTQWPWLRAPYLYALYVACH
jgi:hypothetical protein